MCVFWMPVTKGDRRHQHKTTTTSKISIELVFNTQFVYLQLVGLWFNAWTANKCTWQSDNNDCTERKKRKKNHWNENEIVAWQMQINVWKQKLGNGEENALKREKQLNSNAYQCKTNERHTNTHSNGTSSERTLHFAYIYEK